MAFEKGQSGNPDGRPKGSANKNSAELREMIQNFLTDNFSIVMDDFMALKPKDRVKLYCDLLQYGLPKLQASSIDLGFEKLPDDQLDAIVHRLINPNEAA
jgi:hypothetical protein